MDGTRLTGVSRFTLFLQKGGTLVFRKESRLLGPGLECSFSPNLTAPRFLCHNFRGPQTGLRDGVQRQDRPGWACAWPWLQGVGDGRRSSERGPPLRSSQGGGKGLGVFGQPTGGEGQNQRAS